MKMDILRCVVNENIKNNFPEFDMTFIFENEFFNDTYLVESDIKSSNVFKSVKYNIYKNDSFLGEIFLENYKMEEFMGKLLEVVDDYDFKKLYDKNIKDTLLENYNNFYQNFESKIIKKPATFLGEIYKMRKSAGI
jgi:hypothetical protein